MIYVLIVKPLGSPGYRLTYHDFDRATAAYEREIIAGGAIVQLVEQRVPIPGHLQENYA
jgi:hypothetical protein